MSRRSVQLLRNPTDSQIEDAVDVVSRAFEGDVTIAPMTGSNVQLKAPMFRSMIRAGALEGSLYIISDDEKICSIGVWFGPGAVMFGSEAQRALGWDDFFQKLSQEAREWWMNVLIPQQDEFLKEALGDEYKDGWFANIIATDPAYQGRGYATAIIQAVRERGIGDRVSVSLSTQSESNAKWYERLGFKIVGVTDVQALDRAWPVYALKLVD